MILRDLLKEYKINDFDVKDHDFIFLESFCGICFKDAEQHKINNLSINILGFLKNNPDYCGENHMYSNYFECSKCNMIVDIFQGPTEYEIYIVEGHSDDLNAIEAELLHSPISSKIYLSCAEHIIKNIIE